MNFLRNQKVTTSKIKSLVLVLWFPDLMSETSIYGSYTHTVIIYSQSYNFRAL